jgi:hypothetical protein
MNTYKNLLWLRGRVGEYKNEKQKVPGFNPSLGKLVGRCWGSEEECENINE